ncbi:MAG TPA: glycosyltransferase [Gemmataceae bacterium]|nr:glycosyltransferase [Gemmataceae bacterium]
MKKIKILYYNWVDFEDEEERGGGVSIYQRNLVDAATRQGDEVWFLSSGVSYSPFSSRPFIREVKARKEGVRKFEVVNSTLFSPGHEAFGVEVADSPAMDTAFADFLREHGPFDVIHFNNLEGIPVSFLRLAREHYPQAKVIYSVHNYFAFCPQVNLWFQEKATCQDFRAGRKCVNCLMKPANPRGTRRLYRMEYCLRKLGVRPQSALYRLAAWLVYGPVRTLYRLAKTVARGDTVLAEVLPDQRRGSREATKPTAILDPNEAAQFARRRQRFVDALNTYTDHILAVSQRVAELAIGFGIDASKVQTLYIGTRFAPSAIRHPPSAIRQTDNQTADGGLRIAYLGYMRRDKGFYFYLDALQKMPAQLARRLGLVFAVKMGDPFAYDRIKRMAHRFASVTFYDGYTHAQLPQILSGVDLGIVPVLWEDNLPQVAIECVASGVPILTSNRGGAKELLNCPDLVFRAGSRADFYAKLQAVLEKPAILSTALAGRARLYSLEDHYQCLRGGFYRDTPQTNPATAGKNLWVTAI